MVAEIRRVGASLRLIGDGDICIAMAPSIMDSGIDLYLGIGGSPELFGRRWDQMSRR
jgi:fructose-1,6-bisphosphatase II